MEFSLLLTRNFISTRGGGGSKEENRNGGGVVYLEIKKTHCSKKKEVIITI
jgi:hypothetical protein